MIKINLASRKGPSSGGALGGTRLTMVGLARAAPSLEQLKGLPIRKITIPLIIGFAASYTVDNLKEQDIAEMNVALDKVNAERPALLAQTNKMKAAEETKKTLETDESTIRIKIDTIQKLIAGRTTPPKLLMALSTAIPKDVWLSEFQLKSADIKLKGYSLGFNQISDFMKNLNENAYFMDLGLKTTQQVKDESGAEVAYFELAAKRR